MKSDEIDLIIKGISENKKQMPETKELYTLGFSPCPNDTFMFDALVNGRIDPAGFSFESRLEDVETLNKLAFSGELDVTKLSFAAYSKVTDKYQLLTSGSALGNGVGPLFISKKKYADPEKEIKTVAIPGRNTTAYFLFKLFFPSLATIKEYVFSDIESAIINGEVDAGVIIHENRFTYAEKGLKKICDLGELWEKQTNLPIPLGGICVRRNLNKEVKNKINELLRQSVEYAFTHPNESNEYVRTHSQEMSKSVIDQHIKLYVNDFSLELGENGKQAILYFLNKAGNDYSKSEIFV